MDLGTADTDPQISAIEIAREAQRQKETEFVNVGEPTITGLNKDRSGRKEMCEDVKLNDPEKGLLLVGDGVSMAAGWFAARELATAVQENLGEALDQGIENELSVDGLDQDQQMAKVDTLVRDRIEATLLEVNTKIHTEAASNPEMKSSATTASVTKLVEMPNGVQRLFFSNAGDSRIYVKRGRELFQLTKDDNLFNFLLDKRVAEGQDREAAAASIERNMPQSKHAIVKSIGGQSDLEVSVQAVDVLPGDRILIVSDGVSDQFSNDEIKGKLDQSRDDRGAERVLQNAADARAADENHPLSKPDDIAAAVRTIGERGPDRSYLKEEVGEGEEVGEVREGFTPNDVDAWQNQITVLEQEISALSASLEKPDIPNKERIALQLMLKTKEHKRAHLEYSVAYVESRQIAKEVPPRFGVGDMVAVMDLKQSPPQPFPQDWKVAEFNEPTGEYLMESPAGRAYQRVDRFILELWQQGSLVRLEDTISMPAQNGEIAKLGVADISDGEVTLTRQLSGESFQRATMKETDANKRVREQLRKGALAKRNEEVELRRMRGIEAEIASAKKQQQAQEAQDQKAARDEAIRLAG